MRFLKLFLVLNLLIQVGCSVFGVGQEETLKYKVIQEDSDKEIRLYPSYIRAKTTVKGTFKSSQSKAFKRLAGYIFGGNKSNEKMEMTSPVIQKQKASSKKISMTSPVIQAKNKEGWVMSFVMPSKYKMDTLPKPDDKNVVLEEMSESTRAVIKFTGFWSETKNQRKAEELKKWVEAKTQFTISSESQFAGYNPPWTLPFLRRNEVHFELNKSN